MRTDVKLGVVVAMVVVLVAGGYYMYRDREQRPIEMGDKVVDATPAPDGTKPAVATGQPPRSSRPSPGAARPTPTSRGPATQNRRAGNTTPRQPSGTPQNAANHTTQPTNRVATQPAQPRTGPNGLTPAQRLAEARRVQAADQRPGSASNGRAHPGQAPGQRVADSRQPAGNAGGNQGAPGTPTTRTPTTQLPPVPVKTADATSKQPAASPEHASRAVPLTATHEVVAAIERHRVQSGDTLAGLAVEYYGSERYTQFLIDANKQLANPNHLKIGDMVNIPPAPRPTAAATPASTSASPGSGTTRTGSAGQRTYTVQSGDSFYAIARDQLGDANRWKELFELNRGVVGGEPTALRVGQVLVLPN